MSVRTRQRCFEDVTVGEALPALPKGTISTAHLMRWSAAIENWHRIHYDRRYVTTRITRQGLKLLDRLEAQVDALHDDLLGHLGTRKLRSLIDLLGEVRDRPG